MKYNFSFSGKTVLIFLRIIIGGHIFFNGMIKFFNPNWSARSFLIGSYGIFKWLASQNQLMNTIDLLNIWILILAGIALVIGFYERIAALTVFCLLSVYYLAYPPLNILSETAGSAGPAFLVNPQLIEIVAVLLIFFIPTGKIFGIDRLVWLLKKGKKNEPPSEIREKAQLNRREVIRSLSSVPLLAVFSIPFFNKNTYQKIDASSGATALGKADVFGAEYKRLKELDIIQDESVIKNRENMPFGVIGNMKVSRLIAGNSIISENYGARDLEYVTKLAKTYNTEDRILMTLKSIESSGINAIFLTFRNFQDFQLLNYWKEWGGKLQWISELQTYDPEKIESLLERNLKIGASAICISRMACDKWVANKEYDNIPKAIDIVKKYNIPVGVGGYYNETFAFAVKEKLEPDFYFKSFHKDTYWSAHPASDRKYMEIYNVMADDHNSFHNNLWCRNPEEFAELMKNVNIPWIAFKTNAAGAIPVQEGFEFAIRNGADFVCNSLYDFQVGDSVRSLKRAYLNI